MNKQKSGQWETCNTCRGKGFIEKEPTCPDCTGRGLVLVKKVKRPKQDKGGYDE